MLVAHAVAIAPDRLILIPDETLCAEAEARLSASLAAREARRPMAQILGERLFFGRRFIVTPDVLDPRPETELLVEAALSQPFERVLDLGTGTGAVLLSVLAEAKARGWNVTGLGTDVSDAALNVARANQLALNLEAEFLCADWWQGLEAAGRFDLILSNPPYISAAEMADLAPELAYEPDLALSPGGDGLDAYRAIILGLGPHLAPDGRVAFEIGAAQGPAVMALLAEAGLRDIACTRDLDGRDRVVTARAARS